MKKLEKKHYIFILLLLLIGLLILCLRSCEDNSSIKDLLPIDEIAENWEGKQQLPNEKQESGQIEIPGFETLVFTENQKNQKVNFYNPENNNCLFQMNLFVDNIEYWKSGYVSPGKGYYNIELTDTLKSGRYDAYLLYNCYKEDGTKLNGAEVQFELIVQ